MLADRPDRHPPRRLRKNRAGRRDPPIRDGGRAIGFVAWACSCFELTVDPHSGRLCAWQVDRMPDGSERWLIADEFWRNTPPQEVI